MKNDSEGSLLSHLDVDACGHWEESTGLPDGDGSGNKYIQYISIQEEQRTPMGRMVHLYEPRSRWLNL